MPNQTSSTAVRIAAALVFLLATQRPGAQAADAPPATATKPPASAASGSLPMTAIPAAPKPATADPAVHPSDSSMLPPITPEAAAAEVVNLLSGEFNSAAQAAADTSNEYRDIHLSIVPAWTDRTDGHWLYVEQAVATALDRPYRQRVYHVVPGADGTVVSEIWLLPGDNTRFVGEYKKAKPLEGLTPQELKRMDGCEVRLTRTAPHRYEGATPDRACKSAREGAVFTTSIVSLSADGIDSWDRGWDDAGLQVWGAVSGPYKFRR